MSRTNNNYYYNMNENEESTVTWSSNKYTKKSSFQSGKPKQKTKTLSIFEPGINTLIAHYHIITQVIF
jgi:hypothetical protein